MRRNGRRLMLCTRIALATAACACLLPATAPHAQGTSEDPSQWQSVLALQMQEKFNCQFEKVLFVREFELAGKTKMEGRARCVDRREVDFSRNSPHEKFDVRLCEPTVC
ncbi:MAG: hypothetical protein AB7U49_11830 [Hyphomicrobiaceae bacterium]